MIDSSLIKQLIDKIFFKGILTEIPLEAHLFLKGDNTNFDLHSNPPGLFSWEGNSVECFVEHRNYDALMDLVNTQYGITEDMHYGIGINQPTSIDRYLSISDLVELVDNNFWIVLKRPTDFGVIHETITEYLLEMNTHITFNEYYKRPPDEDINKLKKLKYLIEVIAKPYVDKLSKSKSLGELFKPGSNSSLTLSNIKIDPSTNHLATLLKDFKVSKGNDYKFS